MDDDLYLRECECGHREHLGACFSTVSTFYPIGAAVPSGARVMVVRPNKTEMQRVDERCVCERFNEYQGPDEPPDL